MKRIKRYAAGKTVESDYESSDDARNLIAAAEREERDFKGMGPDVFDETGMKSRLKRNMETGELYDPEGTKSTKAASKPTTKPQPNRTAFQKRADKQTAARAARAASSAARKNQPLGQMSDVVAAKKGGKVSSASSRADGIAQRGKTRGRMI